MSKASSELTNLVEHLITLVKNESLDVTKGQLLIPNQGVETTGGGDHNVRVSLLVLEKLNVLLNGGTTVEHSGLNVRKILGETSVLVLDLVGQFTGVTHHKDLALASDGLQLVKSGQNEDRSLTKTGLGLAKNVDIEDGSWDADLLDCR